jgi:LuxR family transcriptional regulator, quorum-sensing system regulator BjaR1
MDDLQRVDQFIRDIDAAPHLEAVREVLHCHLHQLGFERFSYQKIVAPTGRVNDFYLSTYPREWIKRYNRKRYISCDIRALSAPRFGRPYLWTEIGPIKQYTKEQQTPINEGREFGIISGASIPVYGPDGTKAHLAIASDRSAPEFEKFFLSYRHVLHLMTTYLHARLDALHFYDGSPAQAALTPREIEILTWGAQGKTNEEIGAILSIAPQTVMKHYQNAGQKLNAANKTHAVAIALILRLIAP